MVQLWISVLGNLGYIRLQSESSKTGTQMKELVKRHQVPGRTGDECRSTDIVLGTASAGYGVPKAYPGHLCAWGQHRQCLKTAAPDFDLYETLTL